MQKLIFCISNLLYLKVKNITLKISIFTKFKIFLNNIFTNNISLLKNNFNLFLSKKIKINNYIINNFFLIP